MKRALRAGVAALMLTAFLVSCGGRQAQVSQPATIGGKPAWVVKGVPSNPDPNYYYAVGVSDWYADENEAREEAFQNAARLIAQQVQLDVESITKDWFMKMKETNMIDPEKSISAEQRLRERATRYITTASLNGLEIVDLYNQEKGQMTKVYVLVKYPKSGVRDILEGLVNEAIKKKELELRAKSEMAFEELDKAIQRKMEEKAQRLGQ